MYSNSVASKVPHGESSFLMPTDDQKDIIHNGLLFTTSFYQLFVICMAFPLVIIIAGL